MVCEDVSPRYVIDDEVFIEAADISEALTNLTYLLRADANDPAKVRMYVELAEDRTQALRALLHSIAEQAISN